MSADEKRRLLERLTEVEGFERYLRRAFLGQKQFSIEGLDVMVPMLDESIELAAEAGAHEVVIGMAHRGRLNVLAHTIGQPYESILREFEGERTIEAVVADPEGGTGDVKYHLGAEGVRKTASGEITVTLCANPSHLEAVDPVVEGRTRAEQTDRSTRAGVHDPGVALPILIHGDASFAGQGVVAETLNLEGLAGYTTGGTLHLIANNQIGFTTDPAEGRSTRYSSDLAKGFDIPIIHVNADDPEAAISAIRLALAFRRRFGHDVVVDLVGYRRFGHNEQDEPAYTQPLMAQRIAAHPTVREQFAGRLVEEGVIDAGGGRRARARVEEMLRAAHERLKATVRARGDSPEAPAPPGAAQAVAASDRIVTAVAAERLRELDRELVSVPEHFTVHPKLARQLERRTVALDEGGIDWGQAESLAFASLLVEGIPIRLTGQDTERGTFSHRHLVLHDANTGERYTPMQHLEAATASFEVHNSPLSEYAAVGFEYGYSIAAPEALVLWEAQFGDFVNGAQIILDQFVVAGLSKWSETLRLVLLLPHGYEGNGPEHSSARLERFLQSTAQDNIRVVNPSTAAQYFHLLRRQALDPIARPLVVMTPKGLLRLREAASTLAELAEGSFRPVIDDPAPTATARAGSSSARARSTTTSPGTSCAPAPRRSPSPGSSSSIRSRRPSSRRSSPRTRTWPRSSGRRRSRRTWARGARSATGSRRRCRPAFRSATSAGPGARARARAIRPRTCASRTGSPARRSASRAPSALRAPPRPSRSGQPGPRSAGRTASRAPGGPGAAAAKGEARRRRRRTRVRRRFRFDAVSAHLHPHIRTRPSAFRPTVEPVAPKQFRYNPAPIIESPQRRFVCRSRRRRFSARSSRSISSSSAATRSSKVTCRSRATSSRIRSTTIHSSSRRSRPGWRRRWTASSRSSRSRRWRIPGRARTRSSTSSPTRASGAARATSTGATNPRKSARVLRTRPLTFGGWQRSHCR